MSADSLEPTLTQEQSVDLPLRMGTFRKGREGGKAQKYREHVWKWKEKGGGVPLKGKEGRLISKFTSPVMLQRTILTPLLPNEVFSVMNARPSAEATHGLANAGGLIPGGSISFSSCPTYKLTHTPLYVQRAFHNATSSMKPFEISLASSVFQELVVPSSTFPGGTHVLQLLSMHFTPPLACNLFASKSHVLFFSDSSQCPQQSWPKEVRGVLRRNLSH